MTRMAPNGGADTHQICPVLKVERPPSRCRFTLTGLITDVTRGRQGRNSNLLETGSGCGQTNSSTVIERAMRLWCGEAMEHVSSSRFLGGGLAAED